VVRWANPFSPYLYEWIILGAVAFASGILMLTFGVLDSGLLVLMVVGALPLAMYYAEHLLARYIKPSYAFRRYTKDPPADGTRMLAGPDEARNPSAA